MCTPNIANVARHPVSLVKGSQGTLMCHGMLVDSHWPRQWYHSLRWHLSYIYVHQGLIHPLPSNWGWNLKYRSPNTVAAQISHSNCDGIFQVFRRLPKLTSQKVQSAHNTSDVKHANSHTHTLYEAVYDRNTKMCNSLWRYISSNVTFVFHRSHCPALLLMSFSVTWLTHKNREKIMASSGRKAREQLANLHSTMYEKVTNWAQRVFTKTCPWPVWGGSDWKRSWEERKVDRRQQIKRRIFRILQQLYLSPTLIP